MDNKLAVLLDRTLDPDYGIIRYIKELPLMPEEPDIFITVAEFQDPFIVSPRGEDRKFRMDRQSAGASLDRESSIWSAIGEGIERFGGAVYDPDSITWAASKDLQADNFVHPNDFILFSKDQYDNPNIKYTRHNPNIPIGWTTAKRLSDQKKVYFPASLAFFAYEYKDKSEYLTDSYSTGLACGPTKEWAACSGLYEVIERDAYSLHWAAKQSPKKIEIEQAIDCADPELKKLLIDVKRKGIELFLCDITNDIGVPTIMAISKIPNKPGIALGASSNLCIKTALKKAIVESFHTFNWCLITESKDEKIKKEEILMFLDHVRYYMENEEQEQFADFFWKTTERSELLDGLSSTSPLSTLDHAQQLEILVSKLEKLGHHSYLIDITPNDIANLGLHVTKAVVPSLQPMWCGYGRVPLDRRRFEQFLKYKGKDLNIAINEEIHPFP
ncbi:hypothetical protein A8C32_17205 [Flavivirga aquatica]|uniref:YcaO domain-containing protein n=1 Tax=Flavivirga aquatica TaxID=1849968 RepID=A0A1E5T835_9FLAO|nr:YcaO-like family protein [Flavivirga aquatica]OEK07534.1 hypothetical protein A8C32_17205 [Flavivirga aquatica]